MEEERKVTPVEYVVYEGAMARAERHAKRLWIAIIALIVSLLLCNGAWLLYISQYDFESYTYSQDGAAVNIMGDSNTYNGAEESHSQTNH